MVEVLEIDEEEGESEAVYYYMPEKNWKLAWEKMQED